MAESELVPFSLGELYGPCQCSVDGCKGHSWLIWMTPQEYETAKSQEDMHPVHYVFTEGIGKPLCENHRLAHTSIGEQ